MKPSKRDRLYRKAEKTARKLKGEFLHEGHVLQGLTPLWLIAPTAEDSLGHALRLADRFRCRVIAELDSPLVFSGSGKVWLRVWVDEEFVYAIRSTLENGGKP